MIATVRLLPSIALVLVATLLLSGLVWAAETGGPPDASCDVKGFSGSYSYDPTSNNGPNNWATIPGESFETCGSGSRQSPINFGDRITYATISNGAKPSIISANMTSSAGSFNWALNCEDDCGTTTFRKKKFKLLNLHFHAPSEHLWNGTSFPLEAHMVHRADDGSLAVIATMFDYVENTYAAKVAAAGNVNYGASTLVEAALKAVKDGMNMIPLDSIIDESSGYCSYVGSLTTPPCTEGVRFFMGQTVFTVSKRQVAQYKLTAGVGLDGNNRPTQKMNRRKITCYIQK